MDNEIKDRLAELEEAIAAAVKGSHVSEILNQIREGGWNINVHFMLTAIRNELDLTEDDHDFLKDCGIKW